MPRYLMSVPGPAEQGKYGSYETREEMLAAFADTGAFNERLERDGHLVLADGLQPPDTATTVDARNGTPVFIDGPYVEAKEYLGGFWVIDAADLDEALALAAEGSRACRGRVEVRPMQTEESVRAMLDS